MYLRLDCSEHRQLDSRSHSHSVSRPQPQPHLQPQSKSQDSDPCASFVDGLGVGQVASRQALVAPYLGDIELAIGDQRGMLEVEVVQVRHLRARTDSDRLPCEYAASSLLATTSLNANANAKDPLTNPPINGQRSALCQSLPDARQEVHRKVQNRTSATHFGPSLQAVVYISRHELQRLRPPSDRLGRLRQTRAQNSYGSGSDPSERVGHATARAHCRRLVQTLQRAVYGSNERTLEPVESSGAQL